MSAYRDDFVTLGGLTIGSRGIDVQDYDDLLSGAAKRGDNRVVPGSDGRAVRPRKVDELRAVIVVRLRGDWTQDNGSVASGDRVATLYNHLAVLREVTESTAVQDLELQLDDGWVLGPVDCQVEDGGRLQRDNPWSGVVVVDVTLPDGPLDITATS